MIARVISDQLNKKLFKGKAILVIGPRQVGKTTIVQALLSQRQESTIFFDGDDPTVSNLLANANTEDLRGLIGKHEIIFIDEAQRIPALGLKAKIIVDQFKDRQLITSGSSAFDINNQMQEPLTGRKWTFHLWPVSWQEYEAHVGMLKAEQTLEQRLVFGFYPDVIMHEQEQERVLRELAASYLYKDVLIYGNLKKPVLIEKILQALAYQIGHEVKYKEVAETVGADPKTVNQYIEILEKAYIIFRLPAFSRNLRTEIKTTQKIYFYDNGIRNAVIGHYASLAERQDVGALWENFLMSERLKKNSYEGSNARSFFWRTKLQQEIDYVEEREGQLFAYEMKWNAKRKAKFPATFAKTYSSQNQVINRGNFREFVKLTRYDD